MHCYAHCLNLSLVDSICVKGKELKKDRIVFNFLGTVQFVYSYIEGSPMRHATFEKISKEHGSSVQSLKSCSTTRWACRAEAVSAVKNNYSVLLKTLEEIISNYSVPEMRAKGQGLLYQLKSFDFIFCLNMMDPILQMVLKISSYLQTPSWQTSVKKNKISTKLDVNKTQHVFKTKNDELRVLVFYNTLDTLCQGLDIRFKQNTLDLISAVGMLVNLNNKMETTSYNVLSKYFYYKYI